MMFDERKSWKFNNTFLILVPSRKKPSTTMINILTKKVKNPHLFAVASVSLKGFSLIDLVFGS